VIRVASIITVLALVAVSTANAIAGFRSHQGAAICRLASISRSPVAR